MYRRILVPIAEDAGEATDETVAVARTLCAPDGAITLLHVVEHIPPYVLSQIPPELIRKSHDEAVAMLKNVAARSSSPPDTALREGHGARTILQVAEAEGVDCIVMRSHRPEVQDVFFGSTAAHVVRHAPCSVHVLR